MLVDTDVLVWYIHGNERAYRAIEGASDFFISAVSYMELVQGLRSKKELIILRRTIRDWNCRISHITEEISAKAMFYVEQHFLSHSLQLADALIGATAVTNGLPLLTANEKHYRAIKELRIQKFIP